jgi:16S rRNA (uracil1498-N3)-methyltransferase
MRIPRIFHDGDLEAGSTLSLATCAASHLARVLRLRAGDSVTLFNGLGGEFSASLTSLSKREVIITVGSFRDIELESPLTITLAQGISKGERMDYTLQKAVELGVTRIIPVITARTVVRLDEQRQHKRLEHWQGVIISACEQCGRNTLPELGMVTLLHDYLNEAGEGNKLLLEHRATTGIGSIEIGNDITLMIGPEGGLSQQEIEAACAAGFYPVRFGPRVLRTETAAVAAVAILQSRRGDLA